MAEITLRSYTSEIDGLIELERLDEAIAHCRQILQIIPKHLDTYRLLGKAYLEAKRYGDASDIFQRVLSSEPADFVSHIGMSVIREDDGNLDSSIWHMERAFETNPANQVIQQELKRLFGARDGTEPLKVRLTRGALARMYANGELYPQAVAELRAALQEDPDRPDLQILLSEMYWRTNQQLEAAEVCSQVLEKLPHCREANRIMSAVLQSSGKSNAAAVYLRRLAAIDPYTAFLESPSDDIANVDAESVTLEKLDWQAGNDLGDFVRNKPEWATSLGTDLSVDEKEPEGSPSWMELLQTSSEENQTTSDLPEAQAFFPDASDGDEPIPDWMRDGGWDEATGEATEERLTFSDDELGSLEEGALTGDGLAPAEIPDWLKDIAPDSVAEPDASPPAESEAVPSEGTLPDWLQGIAEDVRRSDEESAPLVDAGQLGTDEPADAEDIPEPAGEEGRDVPTWLEESEPGGAETIVTWLGAQVQADSPEDPAVPAVEEPSAKAPQEEGRTSSWLEGVAEAAAQDQPEEDLQQLATPEADEEQARFDPRSMETRELSPDRLQEFTDSEERIIAQAADDTAISEPQDQARWEPEFEVSEIADPTPEPSSTLDDTLTETLEGEGTEWLQRLSEGPREPVEPSPQPSNEAEVPSWLRRLAADTGSLEMVDPPTAQDAGLIVEHDTLAEEPEATEPVTLESTAASEPPLLEPLAEEPEATIEMTEPATLEPAAAEPPVLEPLAEEPEAAIETTEPITLESAAPSEPPVLEPLAEEPEAAIETTEPVTLESAAPSEPPVLEPLAEEPEATIETTEPVTLESPTEAEPSVSEPADDPALAEPALAAEQPAATERTLKPGRPSTAFKLTGEQAAAMLEDAWGALEAGDIQGSAEQYEALVRAKTLLNEVIDDLQKALKRYPDAPILWQVLGDAHMKADRLSDAVDAYRQGLDTI